MMTHNSVLLPLLLCAFPIVTIEGAAAAEGDRKAVLRTVQTLLDGWRDADPGKLEAVLHPGFREVTLHLQEGKWNFAIEERDRLIKTMARISKGAWDDRLIDSQILIDGPIAVVWSHYKFTVRYTDNGVAQAPVHCGIETFQLYRTEAGWKIVNFADTHSDTCD